MAKYRKKPVVIEAIQFTDKTKDMCYNFIRCACHPKVASGNHLHTGIYPVHCFNKNGKPILKIATLEGEMTADIGDFIIKGINGEFYPCKPDIFEKTYELVEE